MKKSVQGPLSLSAHSLGLCKQMIEEGKLVANMQVARDVYALHDPMFSMATISLSADWLKNMSEERGEHVGRIAAGMFMIGCSAAYMALSLEHFEDLPSLPQASILIALRETPEPHDDTSWHFAVEADTQLYAFIGEVAGLYASFEPDLSADIGNAMLSGAGFTSYAMNHHLATSN